MYYHSLEKIYWSRHESNRSFHTELAVSVYMLYCWPTYNAGVIIAYSFIND